MSKKRLEEGVLMMNRVREILRLSESGLSQRDIHRATRVARSCIQIYLQTAKVHGISYEIAERLSDSELREALKRKTPGRKRSCEDPEFESIHRELMTRKGMTLLLLWKEWMEAQSDGYGYVEFCRRYRLWARSKSVVMRQEYKPGEFVLCDYAGEKLSWIDDEKQEHSVEIFVGVLGASNYTYAEATSSQQLLEWIGSNTRMLEHLGGIPEGIIIDNLKSGVTKICRYEPEINRTYEEFGAHYNTAIIPARPNKPRDKSKVEKAVQEVERWVLSPLRHHMFHSIAEMNQAMRSLLEKHNDRQMKEYGASRRQLFEQLDKPVLRSLPQHKFVVGRWRYAKVALDYHIQCEFNYYSVPYWLAGQSVWVKTSEHLVEVFHNNVRVCSHMRQPEKYRYCTVEAHMPPNHLAMKSRTPAAFLSWAITIGKETKNLVQSLLDQAKHKELAYRSILGLQRLSKKYPASALEEAAKAANERKIFSQRFVRQFLEAKEIGVTKQVQTCNVHSNIRGANYYH